MPLALRRYSPLRASATVLILALLAPALWAGGTPDPGTLSGVSAANHNQLFGVLGPDRGAGFGDYVTDDFVGLQSLPGARFSYDFYVEVPQGQTTLTVSIFDADLGAGELNATTGNVELHDQDNTTMGWDIMTEYELFDPDGNSVASIVLGSQDCDPVTVGNQVACDDSWSDLGVFTVANPIPGHWRFAVSSTNDTSQTDITEEDDNNSFGIRANDGDPTAAGTEFNVYADTYIGIGQVNTNVAGSGRDYDLFPMVVSGCSFDSNDFDSDPSGDESITYTTRMGSSPTFSPVFSGNGVWTIPPDVVSAFTSGAAANDYGLWDLFWETGSFNFITYWLGDNSTPADHPNNNAAPNQLPDEQPETGSFRFYLPADGSRYFGLDGGADDVILDPIKPWVGHSWAVISGPDPILAGATSRVRVTVTINNSTPFPIQFDAATAGSEIVTANVPSEGGQLQYVAGSTTITGGSSTATAESGAGPWVLSFAPGVVASSATATLTYDVDVTPSATGTLNLTGTDFVSQFTSSLGTEAVYLDETCANGAGGASVCGATAQSGATQTYGPLCNLFVDVTNQGVPDLTITKSAGVVTDAGGGLFDVTYTVQVENSGTTNLLNVQVTDDLTAAFAPPATFSVTAGPLATGTLTANGSYDGDGDTNLLNAGASTLLPSVSESITYTVRFDPNGQAGPFVNTANGTADDPLGGMVSDNDDATVVPPENPLIAVTKTTQGPVVDNMDGTFTVNYEVEVENLGNVDLDNVQVVDDLDLTFPPPASVVSNTVPVATGTLTANAGYNGSGDTNLLVAGSSTLPVGAMETITFSVTFDPGAIMGPLVNTAIGSGDSPGGTTVQDSDTAGIQVTPGSPQIGLAKATTGMPVDNMDGTFTVGFLFTLDNLGDLDLTDVQVTDDLAMTFPPPASVITVTPPVAMITSGTGTLTANPAYDGTGDTDLLVAASSSLDVGSSGEITFEVTFDPGGDTLFENSAMATADSGGGPTSDTSDDGTVTDTDGDGNPDEPGENDPTPIVLPALMPVIPMVDTWGLLALMALLALVALPLVRRI